jgi:hypothetical protein
MAEEEDPAASLGLEGSDAEALAATKIQASFRGRVVRGGASIATEAEAHEIVVDDAAASLGLTGSEDETAAASRIQSIQRGKPRHWPPGWEFVFQLSCQPHIIVLSVV